ncbi:helix-turn-helix domain-containing protein [Gaoshiqia sp. Z1-71]|uniref:helix-turn-helix domain-containing protein n=1 Tax=Gaoshiqia hydrogeniformans TaxID=3290090 RepID=UPI003BF82D82
MTINKRIAKVMESHSLNKNQFANKIGVHATVVHNIIDEKGRGNKPSFDFISKLLSSFDNINGDWLITGRGKMFLQDKEAPATSLSPILSDKNALEMIRDLSAENALLKKELEELKGKV